MYIITSDDIFVSLSHTRDFQNDFVNLRYNDGYIINENEFFMMKYSICINFLTERFQKWAFNPIEEEGVEIKGLEIEVAVGMMIKVKKYL